MKTLLIALLISISFSALSQNSTISGNIDNPNENYITLSVPSGKRGVPNIKIDSIVLKDGSFKSSIQIDSLTEIILFDGKEFAFFTIQPKENIQLYINTLIFDESLNFNGNGSERNNFLVSCSIAKEIYTTSLNKISNDLNTSDTSRVFEGIRKEKNHLKANLEFGMEKFPSLKSKLEIEKSSLDYILKNFLYRKNFEIAINKLKKTTKGKDFSDFEALDLEGNTKTLKDFTGKPIIIDFWATWCGPCKKEMPYLKEIEEEFHGKINVLSINCYDKKEKWEAQAKGLGAENSVYMSKEKFKEMNEKYTISYIPRFMLLDKNGKILDISAERPSAGLKQQIERLLEN
jgi:thiol-disulfide isomerase/thioredoxin